MITKEYTYKKAIEQKNARLQKLENERELLLNAAYASNNRLCEIDNEFAKIGADLAITALSGNTEKLETLKALSTALSREKADILKKFDIKEIEYECELCRDTGYVKGKICDCIKTAAAAILAEESSLLMPLKNCTFENFDLKYYTNTGKDNEKPKKRMTSVLKHCKEYALHFDPKTSKNLLFFGDAGLGKTHLTLAIVSEVIKKGYMPIYGSAENIFTSIEKEKFEGENKGTYDSLLNCDLLVIDDLGSEMITTFSKASLYNLVNTRILSGKPTIINTNLSMKEIETKYSSRISSRFIGEYDWYKFLGEDIRQQKLKKQ